MPMPRILFAATIFAGLISCSSEEQARPDLGKVMLAMVKERLKGKNVETANASQVPPPAPREKMQALGRPVVFISVPRFGTGVVAVELANNDRYHTYMGADQKTITLRDGIITSTRGLAVDLIAQELSISSLSLFLEKEPKSYIKIQRHLTGESTLVTYEYNCAVAPLPELETIKIFNKIHTVQKFIELCRRNGRAFQNDYWVGQSDGIVWKSNQSISKEVGHVTFQRVIR